MADILVDKTRAEGNPSTARQVLHTAVETSIQMGLGKRAGHRIVVDPDRLD